MGRSNSRSIRARARRSPPPEQRLFELIWYQPSLSGMNPVGEAARRRIQETYPVEELGPYTDFEWGKPQAPSGDPWQRTVRQ